MCDFELVTLGDNVVLNEGSSVTGHYYQDGCLHLKEVGACSPEPLISNHMALSWLMAILPIPSTWQVQGLYWQGISTFRMGENKVRVVPHGPLSAGSALQVDLGSGARLEPFAMAKAGTTLAAGASIGPQSTEAVNAAAAKKRGARPAPVLGALGTQLHSRALTASETAYMQVMAWRQSLLVTS